eukprot:CAMPEP_0196655406 /NCGR_PEP_ID=MMETSP1086-20130531/5157_1 /TAXON_ID=77921 /ORGANISM="Cyanoptyche  gloeocystis , Strain SAG4.97" /LENGTH=180 /DNA_ID=CAMNT_0041987695 /DNA_START=521 /DNA_END=1060 /DNA_ORIENTATION=-
MFMGPEAFFAATSSPPFDAKYCWRYFKKPIEDAAVDFDGDEDDESFASEIVCLLNASQGNKLLKCTAVHPCNTGTLPQQGNFRAPVAPTTVQGIAQTAVGIAVHEGVTSSPQDACTLNAAFAKLVQDVMCSNHVGLAKVRFSNTASLAGAMFPSLLPRNFAGSKISVELQSAEPLAQFIW